MPTPEPGVPYTTGGVDDMTAEIEARNDAAEDAAESDTEVAALEAEVDDLSDDLVALPSIEDSDDGRITWALEGSAPSQQLVPSVHLLERIIGIRDGGATISNSNVATSLLASTLTPPASEIANGDLLTFELTGFITNNTGSDQTVTLRLRYASVNLAASGAITLPTNATQRPFRLVYWGQVEGGLLSGVGQVSFGSPTAGAADQIVRTFTGSPQAVALAGWSAIDVTAQLGAASASLTTTALAFVMKHTPAT